MPVSKEINTIKDLYTVFGKPFPYASDAVAYYIFGDKSEDNIILRAFKGVYGKHAEIDPSVVSIFMMDYESDFHNHMAHIDHYIKNLPTRSKEKLEDYF